MKDKKVTFSLERTVGQQSGIKFSPWGDEKKVYKSSDFSFPDDFLWCSAMCANQAEGGYDVDGRGLSNADVIPLGEHRLAILNGEISNFNKEKGDFFPSEKAVDFYHRYKKDIKLLKDAGFNSHKLGISWTRIYPLGDEEKPNEKGLMFYDKVIDELLANNIIPIVEITHWDQPLHLDKSLGGWKNRKMIDYYLKLVNTLIDRYGDKVHYWLTVHEPDVVTSYSYLVAGIVKENEETWSQDRLNASHNMFVASAKAKQLIKSRYPKSNVGTMVGLTHKYPYSCDPRDNLLSVTDRMNGWFFADVLVRGYYPKYALKHFERRDLKIPYQNDDFELLKNNTIDFIMFSYYNSLVIKHDSFDVLTNPYLGDSIDPLGLRIILNIIYDRYQIPIILGELAFKSNDILEKGFVHDDDRIVFLKEHLKAIKDSVCNDGVDIIGCMFWDTVDCISVSKGIISDRYGLIYVDVNDELIGSLNRYPKDSYYAIKEVIANKGVNL